MTFNLNNNKKEKQIITILFYLIILVVGYFIITNIYQNLSKEHFEIYTPDMTNISINTSNRPMIGTESDTYAQNQSTKSMDGSDPSTWSPNKYNRSMVETESESESESETYTPNIPMIGTESETYTPNIPMIGTESDTSTPNIPMIGTESDTSTPNRPMVGTESDTYTPGLSNKPLGSDSRTFTPGSLAKYIVGTNSNTWKPRVEEIRKIIENNNNTPSTNKSNNPIDISTMDDVNNILVDGVFKLRVNIPMMPNYIRGLEFDITRGQNPNYFYLCVEKMVPNCSLSTLSNECYNIYVDDPSKCKIKSLTTQTSSNSYRLVLVASSYVKAEINGIGTNSDFTLVKINDKYYLKNIQTGYMPCLFKNEKTSHIHGEMNNNTNSNVANVFENIYNRTCTVNQTDPMNSTNSTYSTNLTKFIPNKQIEKTTDPIITINKPGCDYNPDKTTYLITSENILNSSPIIISINSDKTISIKLLKYNVYGQPENIFQLSKCNFNVKTYKGIGQVNNPSPVGTVFINLVCFEKDSEKNSNKLDFTVELKKYPDNFMKNNSLISLN
jgi:hypothetical protein